VVVQVEVLVVVVVLAGKAQHSMHAASKLDLPK